MFNRRHLAAFCGGSAAGIDSFHCICSVRAALNLSSFNVDLPGAFGRRVEKSLLRGSRFRRCGTEAVFSEKYHRAVQRSAGLFADQIIPHRSAGNCGAGLSLSTAHLSRMSRAFVREDAAVEDLPDRPISEHPNYVTETGLAQIEAHLARAHADHASAQEAADRAALVKAGRELRYWSARRASAQLISAPTENDAIRFGSTFIVTRDGGRAQAYRIVGEDEADPAQGTISHVSPLARALFGKGVGDIVRIGGREFEVTQVS